MIATFRAKIGTTGTAFRIQALEPITANTLVNLFLKGAPMGQFKVESVTGTSPSTVVVLNKVVINPNMNATAVAAVVVEE